MTPEAMAGLVARWVRVYTRKLPAPIARRRVEEIDADLHDHIAHERARGTADGRIALSIASRMVRGLAADASWRGQHARAITDEPLTAEDGMKERRGRVRSIVGVVLASALILLLPLVANLVTDGPGWTLFDFAVAGVLLVGTGLTYVLVRTKAASVAYRAAVAVALAAALALLWLIGSVGVIGVEGDAADLMYLGVVAIGLGGAVVARFRADGMARALLATALAQALVGVIALLAGKHEAAVTSVGELLGLNGLFVALFVASAWLFRRAAEQQPPAAAELPG